MLIGWLAFQMGREQMFYAAGFESEAQCRDTIGISRRVWGRMTRLAEAFDRLSREEFLAMTADNADLLAKLPEEQRYDPDLLAMARSLTAVAFERQLLQRRAIEEGTPVADVRVKWGISLFEGQRQVVAQLLEEFRVEHGLKDLGTALEWMAMEQTGRKTVVQFLQGAVPRLRRAIKAGTAEEMRSAIEEHVVEMAETIERVKGRR